jgi:hypothetical protein
MMMMMMMISKGILLLQNSILVLYSIILWIKLNKQTSEVWLSRSNQAMWRVDHARQCDKRSKNRETHATTSKKPAARRTSASAFAVSIVSVNLPYPAFTNNSKIKHYIVLVSSRTIILHVVRERSIN